MYINIMMEKINLKNKTTKKCASVYNLEDLTQLFNIR